MVEKTLLQVKAELLEINKICKAFISKNQNIIVDDLNPDDLFVLDEINSIKENLNKMVDGIDYLNTPIKFESHINLTINTDEFVVENGEVVKKNEIIEYLANNELLPYLKNPTWVKMRVNYLDDERLTNLRFRKRG